MFNSRSSTCRGICHAAASLPQPAATLRCVSTHCTSRSLRRPPTTSACGQRTSAYCDSRTSSSCRANVRPRLKASCTRNGLKRAARESPAQSPGRQLQHSYPSATGQRLHIVRQIAGRTLPAAMAIAGAEDSVGGLCAVRFRLAGRQAGKDHPALPKRLPVRNHGVLCCGPDIETTLKRLEDLETFCRDHLLNQIKANSRGKPESRVAIARLIDALTSAGTHALSPQPFSETQS
ncbi:Ribulose-5-phosphate 4-epimerase-relatedepimerase and aldolase [Pseudomonas syringae pv. syringae HS191]|nr:Ribulose-5-phosphate 4-epimerase-relatedepimerase and aldolase [Pseudomonas syringae pv. syringae HS191]